MAVLEARSLNYFAFTNRAIASSYVSMANLQAYMSEAAMLSDLKFTAMEAMGEISVEEWDECMCCFGGPCCATHCVHGAEADINVTGLMLDWIEGKMGSKIQKLDSKANQVRSALNDHIAAIHLSQDAVRAGLMATLSQGSVSSLKDDNMQGASSVTHDDNSVVAMNLEQWNKVFYTDSQKKKRIMAETANASRQDFAWTRGNIPGLQEVLFRPDMVASLIKASLWVGPKGDWIITQVPGGTGGRTGFVDGSFPSQSGGMVLTAKDAAASSTQGKSLASYDWGTLEGTWRDGAGGGVLPMLGGVGAAEMVTGNGARHKGGMIELFNSPHSGGAHDSSDIAMDRFMEFNIGTSAPYNQPAVYGAATTDARVNEHGVRGPYEVAKDGTGTVHFSGVGDTPGTLTLSNNDPTHAFSKAMVYYHRIGDWSDYPNLFNPYWRAKLNTLDNNDMLSLGAVDSKAVEVVEGARSSTAGQKAMNVQ